MDQRRESPLPHLIGQDIGGVLLRIAGMNDQRQTRLPRDVDVHAEQIALNRAVGLVVIVVEPAFTDADYARCVRRLVQDLPTEVRVLVRLVRVDAHGGPDIALTLSGGDDIAPFAFACRDIEEAGDASSAGVGQHLILAFDKALVIEVAMAVDQRGVGSHDAPSPAGISRRGKTGFGLSIVIVPIAGSLAERAA